MAKNVDFPKMPNFSWSIDYNLRNF